MMLGCVVFLNNFIEFLDINIYQIVNFDVFFLFGLVMVMGEGSCKFMMLVMCGVLE